MPSKKKAKAKSAPRKKAAKKSPVKKKAAPKKGAKKVAFKKKAAKKVVKKKVAKKAAPKKAAKKAVKRAAPKKAAKKDVGDSHLETLQLHQQKLSIEEIAEKRELALSTVENHLIQCAQQGMEVDFNRLIPAKYIPLLQEAVEEVGRDRLKPIKEQLPEEVSYFMIKGYLYFLSKRK